MGANSSSEAPPGQRQDQARATPPSPRSVTMSEMRRVADQFLDRTTAEIRELYEQRPRDSVVTPEQWQQFEALRGQVDVLASSYHAPLQPRPAPAAPPQARAAGENYLSLEAHKVSSAPPQPNTDTAIDQLMDFLGSPLPTESSAAASLVKLVASVPGTSRTSAQQSESGGASQPRTVAPHVYTSEVVHPKAGYRGGAPQHRGSRGGERGNRSKSAGRPRNTVGEGEGGTRGGAHHRGGQGRGQQDHQGSSREDLVSRGGHNFRARGTRGGNRGTVSSHGSRDDLANCGKSMEKSPARDWKPRQGNEAGGSTFTSRDNVENNLVDKCYTKGVADLSLNEKQNSSLGAKDYINSLGLPNRANNLTSDKPAPQNKNIKSSASFEKNQMPSKFDSNTATQSCSGAASALGDTEKSDNSAATTQTKPENALKPPRKKKNNKKGGVSPAAGSSQDGGEYTAQQLEALAKDSNEYFEQQLQKVLSVPATSSAPEPAQAATYDPEGTHELHTAEIASSELRQMLPSHWALVKYPVLKSHISVELDPQSPEYTYIASLFHRSVKEQMKIECISRIENAFLWLMYMLKKEEVTQHFGYEPEERKLFHGTDNYNLVSIFESNFNWRKLNRPRHKFGMGVTFSPLASNASLHSRGHPKSSRNVIVARVLVCHERIGTENTIVPPPGFDTTKRPDGKIIVKFDDNTFYPEYVIRFSGCMNAALTHTPFKKVNKPQPKPTL